MRKLFFIAVLCITTTMNAQTTTTETASRFHIGAEAGYDLSNYTGADRNVREGFYVGARGEYQLKECYLSASLRLIRKGADAYSGDSDSDDYYEAYYLELPIAVGLSGRLGSKARIFGETGPYLAVGIGGKAKGESHVGDSDGMKTYKWDNGFFSSANGSPRRFDAGWGVRGGVKFGHVEIAAGYEIGFVPVWNVSDSQLGNYDCHNSSFTLGVAYMF